MAFVVPLATARIRAVRIPVVVGEILVGILIGNSGLGLIVADPWLDFLATLGFTYLMFLSGLEIDFGLLTKSANGEGDRGASPWTAIGIFAATLAASAAASFLLAGMGLIKNPWIMGLILSTTSLGIVVPILKERGLSPTPFGQSIIFASLVADFGTMLLITIAAAALAGGEEAEVLLVLFLFVAFFIFHRLGVRFTRYRIVEELAHATSQIGVRGAFMLIFIFVALAERLGAEVILGAFLAGVIVSLLSERGGFGLRLKLDAIGFGFFIPVFFIMVGVRFDAAALFSSGRVFVLVPVLLFILYAVKLIPALLWVPAYGWKRALAGGLLISSRLSLLIAAADIGLRLDVISEPVNAAIILIAVVTSSISPVLFAKVAPVTPVRKDHCLIVGANRLGQLLAGRLIGHRWDVVLLDVDLERVQTAQGSGFDARLGDATDPAIIKEHGGKSRIVVALVGDDVVNAKIAQAAREALPAAQVIATASDPRFAEELLGRGIRAITPALSTLIVLENMVRHPDLLGLLTEDSEEIRVEDVFVTNARYVGAQVRDLPLPEGVLVISIYRSGERLVPRGTTEITAWDRLTLVGPPALVQQAVDRIGAASPTTR